jgi:histidinol-phosphatase (PHP family)
MEEFVLAAIAAGFHSYGVSSHAPVPFEAPFAMRRERVGEYLAEAARLKRAHAGRIEFYTGMEIDFLDDGHGPSLAYFQELPLDYRIGAIHYVTHPASGRRMDIDGSEASFNAALEEVFDGDVAGMVEAYYDASERMVELGGFDFIAHPDKVAMNAARRDAAVTGSRRYRDRLVAFLERVAARGMMIEVNTKALAGRGILFPDQRYLKVIRELGIPVVVNSDAHLPRAVNEGRARAFELLREAGFRYTARLKDGKWTGTLIK